MLTRIFPYHHADVSCTLALQVGITADLADAVARLSFGGLAPFVQYLLISWSIALLTVPTNEVLASVIGSSIWLNYVTSLDYSGPLTPLRVALACCCPGCLCLTPTHCPPVMVGLSMSRTAGSVDFRRLYALMVSHTLVEVFLFYPLAIWMIVNLA